MTAPAGRPRSGRRWLAAIALGLAALAPVVGSRGDPAGPARPGVAELSDELATGAPLVGATKLARRIRDRRGDRIIDVRDSAEFVRLAVPTAENRALAELPAAVSRGEEIVVYDGGDGSAVRAWLLLRRLGYPRVRVLDRGILGWVEDVLQPVLPNGTPEERARFAEHAELSRYFGGVPRAGRRAPSLGGADRTAQAIALISRRGCY